MVWLLTMQNIIALFLTVLYQSRFVVSVQPNAYDGPVQFNCPANQYIFHVTSYHNNDHEDRQWTFGCRSGLVTNECKDTGSNQLDQPMNLMCDNGYVIAGARSTHDNDAEDRVWTFRCCKLKGEPVRERSPCVMTSALNQLDGQLTYSAPIGSAIKGFTSTHDNGAEDRVWNAYVCTYDTCQATKMTLLQDIQPVLEEAKVVGIASSQGCSKDATFTTSLSSTDSVTETFSFTTTQGGSRTFGASLSVKSKLSLAPLGMGGEVEVTATGSVSTTKSWSNSKTQATSSQTSSSAGQSLKYQGPGAALVMGYVQAFKFDSENVDVEYEITCEDGTTKTETDKATLKTETFSQTHFVQKHGTFDAGKCNEESNACIQAVNGKKILTPDEITREFDKCFIGKGTTYNSTTIVGVSGAVDHKTAGGSFIAYVLIGFLSFLINLF